MFLVVQGAFELEATLREVSRFKLRLDDQRRRVQRRPGQWWDTRLTIAHYIASESKVLL